MNDYKKKVFIRTLGCQMNVRDSQLIAGLLKQEGFELLESSDEADAVIINTCSVRQHAEDRVWSEIGTYKETEKIVGLVGCMAQNYKEQAFEKAPNIHFVIGPQDLHKIPEVLLKCLRVREGTRGKGQGTGTERRKRPGLFEAKIWETEGVMRPEHVYHTGLYEKQDHAFVVISEGCSNFCSYCVVPYVRGSLRHRKAEDIIREIKEGVAQGIVNFNLLGQNVNAYDSSVDFSGLLKSVSDLKGVEEITFMSSHPKDTKIELFKAIRDLAAVKKYIHLPVQSGSNRILKAMNRMYTREEYLALIKSYREIVPQGTLSTDIIVGFPGETEEDFQDTVDLIKSVRFDSAYIFKYSARPHTKAAGLVDTADKKEKERRHAIILELQRDISRDRIKP